MQDFNYAPPVKEVDIADNLTTDDATKVLSAKQGKVLNDSMATLNGKIALVPSGSTYTTLDSIKTFLEGINATLADNEYKEVRVTTGAPTNISPFEGYGYYTGTLTRYNTTTFVCSLVSLTGRTVTINKAGTNWNIDSLSGKINYVAVEGQYTTVLAVINAFRNIKSYPISIQKAGSSAYTDLPAGVTNTCEWNVICYGSNTRIVAELTIYTGGGGNNKKTYTALIYDGAYINNWSSLSDKINVPDWSNPTNNICTVSNEGWTATGYGFIKVNAQWDRGGQLNINGITIYYVDKSYYGGINFHVEWLVPVKTGDIVKLIADNGTLPTSMSATFYPIR